MGILRDSKTLDLAFYEVGNSLLKELRRNILSIESFTSGLGVLSGLSELMAVSSFKNLNAGRVSEVSRLTGLTFYDASYLTLALGLGEVLATNDDYLRDQARRLKVRTVSV